MAFPQAHFPVAWLLPSLLVLVILLGSAVYTAPWQSIRDKGLVNVYLAACVVLLILWRLKAGMAHDLSFHFLCLTAMTLMFGWQLALLCAAMIIAALTFAGLTGWQVYALNVIIDGAVPVLFSYLFFRFVDRQLPNHFFIYVFISAFLGGALAVTLRNMALGVTALLSGTYGTGDLQVNLLPVLLMQFFPEGMLNGVAMTIFVVYRPHWVSTFDDQRYLHNK
jgi:uncharacterized membrane protein